MSQRLQLVLILGASSLVVCVIGEWLKAHGHEAAAHIVGICFGIPAGFYVATKLQEWGLWW